MSAIQKLLPVFCICLLLAGCQPDPNDDFIQGTWSFANEQGDERSGSAHVLQEWWFGRGADNLTVLTATVVFAGFFTNAAIVGLYSLFAKVFPTHVRATGTGFAIGVGRGGAALAPVLAGYLFAAGFGLQSVAIAMGCGALVAAVLLFFLKDRAAD